MIIVFWSAAHGQCGNSTNCGLIASLISKRNKEKGIMLQIGDSANRPDGLFGIGSDERRERIPVRPGIEAALMGIHAGFTDKKYIEDCSFQFDSINLSVLTGPADEKTDLLNMADDLERLVEVLDSIYETVFIDIGTSVMHKSENAFIEKILQKADMEIVSVCQNIAVLDHVAAKNRSASSKTFYIIGQYRGELKWNYRNIKRKYRFITGTNSSVITYNPTLADWVSDRGIEKYLNVFNDDNELNPEYDFIRNVQKACDRIMDVSRKR